MRCTMAAVLSKSDMPPQVTDVPPLAGTDRTSALPTCGRHGPHGSCVIHWTICADESATFAANAAAVKPENDPELYGAVGNVDAAVRRGRRRNAGHRLRLYETRHQVAHVTQDHASRREADYRDEWIGDDRKSRTAAALVIAAVDIYARAIARVIGELDRRGNGGPYRKPKAICARRYVSADERHRDGQQQRRRRAAIGENAPGVRRAAGIGAMRQSDDGKYGAGAVFHPAES